MSNDRTYKQINIHEEINKYLAKKSNGAVRLTREDYLEVKRLIQSKDARIEISRYAQARQDYERVRTLRMHQDELDELYNRHKEDRRVEGFYRWDFYDSDGELAMRLFTLNCHP